MGIPTASRNLRSIEDATGRVTDTKFFDGKKRRPAHTLISVGEDHVVPGRLPVAQFEADGTKYGAASQQEHTGNVSVQEKKEALKPLTSSLGLRFTADCVWETD